MVVNSTELQKGSEIQHVFHELLSFVAQQQTLVVSEDNKASNTNNLKRVNITAPREIQVRSNNKGLKVRVNPYLLFMDIAHNLQLLPQRITNEHAALQMSDVVENYWESNN